jgi:hypothetical protein
MEKSIKASEFNVILNAMRHHYIPHLVDYMGEIPTPTNAICTEYGITDANQDHWYFYTFNTLQDFTGYLKQLLDTLDLTSGGDDQYFDYNPAQLEAILYMLSQLDISMMLNFNYWEYESEDTLNKGLDTLYTQLKQIFDNYFENDELHDMDDLYQKYLDNIDFENHSINIQYLEISNL